MYRLLRLKCANFFTKTLQCGWLFYSSISPHETVTLNRWLKIYTSSAKSLQFIKFKVVTYNGFHYFTPHQFHQNQMIHLVYCPVLPYIVCMSTVQHALAGFESAPYCTGVYSDSVVSCFIRRTVWYLFALSIKTEGMIGGCGGEGRHSSETMELCFPFQNCTLLK